MKIEVSKKLIKENYKVILGIPYCAAQGFTYWLKPFAFSAGVHGWSCDYFELSPDICISTGYSFVRKGEQPTVSFLQENIFCSHMDLEDFEKAKNLLISCVRALNQ